MSQANSLQESLTLALEGAKPLYVLPADPVTSEVLIPALRASTSLDMMMGYFASSSFSEIAPGLAEFLRSTDAPLRLIVSPYLTSQDFEALMKSPEDLAVYAEKLVLDSVPDEHLLAKHTLACLAWLITQQRLQMKIAIMRDALFHPKVWLFSDGETAAALHGSTNLTGRALTRNREQLTLSRSWKGEESAYHVKRLQKEFSDLWVGGDNDCLVLPLPDAMERRIIKTYKTGAMPDEKDLETLWRRAQGVHEPDAPKYKNELRIPTHLTYDSGDFAHQGAAVRAWELAGRRGILEMATGAGKTITSMICAARLQTEIGRLLVVVSAPYRPLIEQWCGEIREFGVEPINLSDARGPGGRDSQIRNAGRKVRKELSRAEVLVVSNDILCTDDFIRSVASLDLPTLLIADECHNLGSESFTRDPPEFFMYRLGLSATPVRQYDEIGTEALLEYFGEICFSFTLEQAIGKCLTEYDYHVHMVELTPAEMEDWQELTEKISAQAWRLERGESSSYLENLLRQRRVLLETAVGKLKALEQLLDGEPPRSLRYALIYATDKQPAQLEAVNAMLEKRKVLFHQLTQVETQSRSLTARILDDFQAGATQVLTAKRVLDEGVNIPQIKLAFILASTTVRRQWIQRRGRLLRLCKAIGKTHAVIHDFVVLPPGMSIAENGNLLDRDARRLVRSELERVWEFARLSRNGPKDGGPYEAVRQLQSLANAWGEGDGVQR